MDKAASRIRLHTIPLRGGNKMEKGVPPIIIPLPYNMGPFESPSNKAKVMEILGRNGYDFKGFENYLSNGHFNITRM